VRYLDIAAHRIDVSRLASGGGDVVALREVSVGRGAYVRARLALLGAVAAAHDCEVVWRTGPDGATGILAGFTSDLDATLVIYESLHLQATSRMAAERRATPAATQQWRRAFLFGYADRAGELLRETRRRIETDVRAASGSSTLPDLAGRADQVRAFASTAFGRVTAASAPAPAAANAYHRGHAAASSADIGRSRLAARPQLGPGGP